MKLDSPVSFTYVEERVLGGWLPALLEVGSSRIECTGNKPRVSGVFVEHHQPWQEGGRKHYNPSEGI